MFPILAPNPKGVLFEKVVAGGLPAQRDANNLRTHLSGIMMRPPWRVFLTLLKLLMKES